MDKEIKIIIGVAISALLIFSGYQLFFQQDRPYDRSSAFTQSTDYSSPLSKLQSEYPTLYNQYKDIIGNTGSNGVDNIHISDKVVFSEDIYSAYDGKLEIPVNYEWYYSDLDDFWPCYQQSNGKAEMARVSWSLEVIEADGTKYAAGTYSTGYSSHFRGDSPSYISSYNIDLPLHYWDLMWREEYNLGKDDSSASNKYGDHEYIRQKEGGSACANINWDGIHGLDGTVNFNFKTSTAFLLHVKIHGAYWDYYSAIYDPYIHSEKKSITIADGYAFVLSDKPSTYVGDEKVDVKITTRDSETTKLLDNAKVTLSGDINKEGNTENGIIIFEDVTEGYYDLTVRKGEYHIKEQKIKISVDNTEFDIALDTMLQSYDVTINALSNSGIAISNAVVRLKPYDTQSDYIEKTTDSIGRVTFYDVRDGYYGFFIKHPDFHSDEFTKEIKESVSLTYMLEEIDNPPVMDSIRAPSKIENEKSFSIDVDAFDPDGDMISEYWVDWGDTPYSDEWDKYDVYDTISHTYTMKPTWYKSFQPEEEYIVTVKAKSKALTSEPMTDKITVCYVNEEPTVNRIIHQPIGYPGIRYTFEVRADDPDRYPHKDLLYKIDWGDGDTSSWTSNPKFSHSYDQPGFYSVKAKVDDGEDESGWYTLKDAKYGVTEENFIVGNLRFETPDITSLSIASPGKTSNAVIHMRTKQPAEMFDIYVYVSGGEGLIKSWSKVDKSFTGEEYISTVKFVCNEEGNVDVAAKAVPTPDAFEGYITSLVDVKRGTCEPYYDKDSPYNKHDNQFKEEEEPEEEPEEEYDPYRNMNDGNVSDEANLYDSSKDTQKLFPTFEILVIIFIAMLPFILTGLWIANRRRKK